MISSMLHSLQTIELNISEVSADQRKWYGWAVFEKITFRTTGPIVVAIRVLSS